MKSMTRIAYTGGPCGGKTTLLPRSYEYFSKMGYRVVIVPEAAALIINAGFKPDDFSEIGVFQESILTVIYTLEEEAEKLAKNYKDRPVLMICDRGTLDGKAYCSQFQWDALLAKKNLTEELLQKRYDAVVDLVSAADGAEGYYSLGNNSARLEQQIEVAREIDRKLQKAWQGHPAQRIIDNSTDFEGKIRRTLRAVSDVLEANISSDNPLV